MEDNKSKLLYSKKYDKYIDYRYYVLKYKNYTEKYLSFETDDQLLNTCHNLIEYLEKRNNKLGDISNFNFLELDVLTIEYIGGSFEEFKVIDSLPVIYYMNEINNFGKNYDK